MKYLLIILTYLPIMTNAQIKIAVPNLSPNLNNLEIHSVSDYVLFDDLLRSLIKYESNGEIAPDIAESWEIENNFKKYIFKIKPNEKFSDGSQITSEDVANSIKKLIHKNEIVHGQGTRITIVKPEGNLLTIQLAESNPFFITELSAPEYRIIKSRSYEVTSGPYYIKKKQNDCYELEINKFYPFNLNVSTKQVKYCPYDAKSLFKNNDFETYDIIWPDSSFGYIENDLILSKNFKIQKLGFGFTYWLSLNPNSLNFEQRLSLKISLNKYFLNTDFYKKNNFEQASQIFLPSGPGRLSESEVKKINENLSTKKSVFPNRLNILLPSNLQKELSQLISLGLNNPIIHYYKNFSEYADLVKNQKFDIALVNNDLSSIDLRSSILVTFNSHRPLIWHRKSDQVINRILSNIKSETNTRKRYDDIKNLNTHLLENVLVYPIYYDYAYLFAKKNLDFTNLSKAGSETFSWKIK